MYYISDECYEYDIDNDDYCEYAYEDEKECGE